MCWDRADVIFYALDRSTGEVVEPQEVINTIERYLITVCQ